ncbi:hypothetical protein AVEN_30946-1 [Araneus ventricosus]|uniref:Uncharacterized protein n=1 Tax=Araneus ventricosus TaxID=182803 RepID=A0A4Y2EPC8_ARAVE|nr:hypothetical protein AVEN_30946-1 [Araneus ventricosus]
MRIFPVSQTRICYLSTFASSAATTATSNNVSSPIRRKAIFSWERKQKGKHSISHPLLKEDPCLHEFQLGKEDSEGKEKFFCSSEEKLPFTEEAGKYPILRNFLLCRGRVKEGKGDFKKGRVYEHTFEG